MTDTLSALYINEEKLRKSSYLYVAAIDFGTSNSGVTWGYASKDIAEHLNNALASQSDGYAKIPTVLVVHKSLLDKLDQLTGDMLSINATDGSANVYFGHHANRFFKDEIYGLEIGEESSWVRFEHFKMDLFQGDGTSVTGSDGEVYDLSRIIELYLRCLVEATYEHMRNNSIDVRSLKDCENAVCWGLTIPTIWEAEQKNIMEEAAKRALNVQDVVFLLEPEGASMSLMANEHIDLQVGMTYMVVDCGGGTTDIAVQKVVRKGGGKALEEMLRTNGVAAAGWEMDQRFYALLARTLAEQDDTVPQEEALQRLILDFFEELPAGKLELDAMWQDFKHHVIETGSVVTFTLPASYGTWLGREHRAIFEAFRGRRGVVVKMERQTICTDVFLPVCSKIVEAMTQFYEQLEARNITLDYLFGAGGLVGLPMLQEQLRNYCPEYMDAETQCLFASADARKGHLPGGAIMEGAACMLVYDECIARVSKRYYYAETYGVCPKDNMMKHIWRTYRHYHENIPLAEFKKLFQKEEKYLQITYDNYNDECRFIFLQPLVFADRPAEKYSETFSQSDPEQKAITFRIYSSTELHLARSTDASDIRSENDKDSGSFSIQEDQDKRYRMEIDFNEFQQSYFDVRILHESTGELKTRIRITPELKRGH